MLVLAGCSGPASVTTSVPVDEPSPTSTIATSSTLPPTTTTAPPPSSVVTQAPYPTLPAHEISAAGEAAIAEDRREITASLSQEGLAGFVLSRVPVEGIPGFIAVARGSLENDMALTLPAEGMSDSELFEVWGTFGELFGETWPTSRVAKVGPEEWSNTFGWSESTAEVFIGLPSPSSAEASGVVLFGGFAVDESIARMEMSPVWAPMVTVETHGDGQLVSFGDDPTALNARASTASALWHLGRGGYVGITDQVAVRSPSRDTVLAILEFDGPGDLALVIAEEMNVAGLLYLSVSGDSPTVNSASYAAFQIKLANSEADIGLVAEGLALTDGGLTHILMVETPQETLTGLAAANRVGAFLVQKLTISG